MRLSFWDQNQPPLSGLVGEIWQLSKQLIIDLGYKYILKWDDGIFIKKVVLKNLIKKCMCKDAENELKKG